MEKIAQGARRRGLLRSIAAGLILAGAITAVVVLFLPATASGRSACPGFGHRPTIKKFDPHKAKVGSNTPVTIWGSHLGDVHTVLVGPKGNQTAQTFQNIGDTIVFTVQVGTVDGRIQVIACGGSAWSGSSLRVNF